MMLLKGDVTQNIVVSICASARPEIPGFLLGVIGPVFESLKLILKVDDIVSLLVPQRAVLIFSEHIYEVLLFSLSDMLFNSRVTELLSDRVIRSLPRLYILVCTLDIGLYRLLPLSARLLVVVQFLLPRRVVTLLLDKVSAASKHRLLDTNRCCHLFPFFYI